MQDLGTFGDDPCSNAYLVNANGTVLGDSTDCHGVRLHAFISKNGGPMIELNAFIPPELGVRIEPRFINASGLIAGQGVLPNGDEHAVVLIPCGGDNDPGCREASPSTNAPPSRHILRRASAANRVRLFYPRRFADGTVQ